MRGGQLGTNTASRTWTTPFTTVNGDAPGSLFGLALAGGGDVNGDLYDDLLVGVPGGTGGLGELHFLPGTLPTRTAPTTTTRITGGPTPSLTAFGRSVAFVGDFSHLRRDQIVAGVSTPRHGAVEIFIAPLRLGDPTTLGVLQDEANPSYGIALSHP